MKCPMCGLAEKYQRADPNGREEKTQCKGCGTIFHDGQKRFKGE